MCTVDMCAKDWLTSQSLHQTRQTHAHVDGLVWVQHGSQKEAMMGKPSMMMTPRLMQEPDDAASLPYPSNVKSSWHWPWHCALRVPAEFPASCATGQVNLCRRAAVVPGTNASCKCAICAQATCMNANASETTPQKVLARISMLDTVEAFASRLLGQFRHQPQIQAATAS